MEQKQNTRYFIRIIRFMLPIYAIVIGMFVFFLVDAIKENILTFYLSCVGIMVLLISIEAYLVLKWTNRRLSIALRSKTPQDMISIVRRKSFSFPGTQLIMSLYSKIIPGLKPSEVFITSLAYTYWGQYDLARQELRKVNWEKQPPIYQSLEKHIVVLHYYIETRDYQIGLKLAENAYRMVQVGQVIPFQKWFYREIRSLIEIGTVLCGGSNKDTIKALETSFVHNRLIIRIPIAWALEKAYIQIGDTQKANQMRAFLNDTAPHCVAFDY